MAIIVHKKKTFIDRLIEEVEKVKQSGGEIDYIELTGNDIKEGKKFCMGQKKYGYGNLRTACWVIDGCNNCDFVNGSSLLGYKVKFSNMG